MRPGSCFASYALPSIDQDQEEQESGGARHISAAGAAAAAALLLRDARHGTADLAAVVRLAALRQTLAALLDADVEIRVTDAGPAFLAGRAVGALGAGGDAVVGAIGVAVVARQPD